MAVLLYHVTARYDQLYGHPEPLAFLFSVGPYGVHLFFLVSGFVILMTLQRSPAPGRFAYTRFSRVFPAYWASVIFAFLVLHLGNLPVDKPEVSTLFANLLLFQHYFGFKYLDGVFWSLVVEVTFYITIFFVLLFKLIEKIHLVCWGWLFLVLSLHAAEALTGQVPWPIFYLLTLKYAHLFVAGMTLYRIHAKGRSVEKLLLLVTCCLTEFMFSGVTGVAMVTFFVIAFVLACNDRLTWINRKPLLYLGTISYSLYLVHQNLSYTVMYQLYELGFSSSFVILAAIICSVLVAMLLTHLIEQPVAKALNARFSGDHKRKIGVGRTASV